MIMNTDYRTKFAVVPQFMGTHLVREKFFLEQINTSLYTFMKIMANVLKLRQKYIFLLTKRLFFLKHSKIVLILKLYFFHYSDFIILL